MKQRGLNTFTQIFSETSTCSTENKKKGRNEILNTRRNDCLIERYYWYGKYAGLRYDIVVRNLAEEFFLSEVTVPRILEENVEKLSALKQMKPDKKYFIKRWPHLTWPG